MTDREQTEGDDAVRENDRKIVAGMEKHTRPLTPQTFGVSWDVGGTRVSSAYSLETLTKPHEGCDSRLEWLLRSLAADGCHHITVSLPIPQPDVPGAGWQE